MIDRFLDRIRTKDYNCFAFVIEVWRELYGEDIQQRITSLRNFKRLERPVSPCFVLMQHLNHEPHVGIYIDRRVLHLSTKGVEYQPLNVVSFFYQTIRFYQ